LATNLYNILNGTWSAEYLRNSYTFEFSKAIENSFYSLRRVDSAIYSIRPLRVLSYSKKLVKLSDSAKTPHRSE